MNYNEFSLLYNDILNKNGLSEYTADEFCRKFYDFYNILIETNKVMNVTRILDAKDAIVKHFADCLLLAELIPDGELSLIDVGCGGGFPTIPLGIARKDLKITAIDSTTKKVDFVNRAARELGLANVTAISARAEEFIEGKRESFDFCTSRAVARLNILSELTVPYVKVGGKFLAMKAAAASEELDEAKCGIKKLGGEHLDTLTFDLYDGDEINQRNVVVVEKKSKTPAVYPRKFAQIKKNPL